MHRAAIAARFFAFAPKFAEESRSGSIFAANQPRDGAADGARERTADKIDDVRPAERDAAGDRRKDKVCEQRHAKAAYCALGDALLRTDTEKTTQKDG